MADRSLELIAELDQELRGLEDAQLRKLRGIFDEALRRTIRSITDRLERIAEQPEYDPATTPGAFLGSTPGGPTPITPLQKNQASLYLQGQLAQDLQAIVNRFPADRAANAALNQELSELYDRAQDLGTEYAIELSRDMLPPAAVLSGRHPALQDPQLPPAAPPAPTDAPAPGSPYQEGQSFTRLLNLGATIAASERDFKTLSANYRRQRNAATDERVRASKDYFFRWWRDWGDTVQFETATQLASGVDSRKLARTLRQRLPHINDAFRGRAETIARTETHIAAGEARERTFRRVGVGFVRHVATADDVVCEFCAPRMGCLYYAGSVKTPLHPNCRCALSPITLEALVIQNQLATNPGERWEAQQQALAAATREKYEEANNIRAWRPIGGTGEARGPQDYPLMERTALPATRPRPNQANNPANGGARPWPSGDPVWTPSRGWINAAAREAYEAMVLEVAELDL
jgi:SPP1 gp7 family putative phage head morphogenesis protein